MASPCANPPFKLANAMFDCGITDAAIFYGNTKASRIATGIFDDDFTSCMDKTYVELDDGLKSCSNLTAAHGQIRLTPGHKKTLRRLSNGQGIRSVLGLILLRPDIR